MDAMCPCFHTKYLRRAGGIWTGIASSPSADFEIKCLHWKAWRDVKYEPPNHNAPEMRVGKTIRRCIHTEWAHCEIYCWNHQLKNSESCRFLITQRFEAHQVNLEHPGGLHARWKMSSLHNLCALGRFDNNFCQDGILSMRRAMAMNVPCNCGSVAFSAQCHCCQVIWRDCD